METWTLAKAVNGVGAGPGATEIAPGLEQKVTVMDADSDPPVSEEIKKARANSACKVAASIYSHVVTGISVSILSKPSAKSPGGYICDVDDDDVDELETVTREALLSEFPDMDLPWWLGISLASASTFLSIRRGRRPRSIAAATSQPPADKRENENESQKKIVDENKPIGT